MEKKFEDTLVNEAQPKTYDDIILWNCANSKSLKMRLLLQKNPRATSQMLEKMLKDAGKEDDELVKVIINDKRLVPTEELFWTVYKSPNAAIRQWIASQTNNTKLLSLMLEAELSEDNSEEEVLAALMANENCKPSEEKK